MDQVTQQNAALVEESAAAAESLKEQAQQLVQAVAVFKLGRGEAAQARPRARTEPHRGRAARPDRARNVTRPRFGTQAKAGRTAQAATRSAEPARAPAPTTSGLVLSQAQLLRCRPERRPALPSSSDTT